MFPRRLPPSAWLVATLLALVAALGVAALVDRGGDGTSAAESSRAGDSVELAPAPDQGELPASTADVRLADLSGGPDRTLGEMIGAKPLVVNFFASWCAPCLREMPGFESVHQSVGDQVTFVGMAYRDAPEDALATVARTGVTYPTFADADDAALTYFGGIEMPTTVFIDASGAVVDVHPGALSEEQLRTKLSDLFGVSS